MKSLSDFIMTAVNNRSIVNVFVSDENTAEAARDMIYENKGVFFHIILPTQEWADMFVMDYVHAPASNFVTIVEQKNAEDVSTHCA